MEFVRRPKHLTFEMQSKFTQTPFPIFSMSARTVILGFRVSGQYWVFSRWSPLVSGPGQHWWRGRSMHRWPCPSLGSLFHKWCRRLFLSTFQKVQRRCRKFQEGAKKVTLQLCTDNPGECWVSLRCLPESLCHLYNLACGHCRTILSGLFTLPTVRLVPYRLPLSKVLGHFLDYISV